MSWGGRRTNAGRKPKSAREHWLAGTGRQQATAAAASHVVDMPPTSDPRAGLGDSWTPTKAQRQRLGKDGRRCLDDLLDRFDIGIDEAAAVLTLASHHDAVGRLQLLLRKAKNLREHVQLERLLLEHQKRIDDLQSRLERGVIDATESL